MGTGASIDRSWWPGRALTCVAGWVVQVRLAAASGTSSRAPATRRAGSGSAAPWRPFACAHQCLEVGWSAPCTPSACTSGTFVSQLARR